LLLFLSHDEAAFFSTQEEFYDVELIFEVAQKQTACWDNPFQNVFLILKFCSKKKKKRSIANDYLRVFSWFSTTKYF